MKKKVITQDKLDMLKHDVLVGKAAKELQENLAWIELKEFLLLKVKEIKEEKDARRTSDYLVPHKVVNNDGDEVIISGLQVLESQVREEIKSDIYLEILGSIQDLINLGTEKEKEIKELLEENKK